MSHHSYDRTIMGVPVRITRVGNDAQVTASLPVILGGTQVKIVPVADVTWLAAVLRALWPNLFVAPK